MVSAWAAVADSADSPVRPTTVATRAATATAARTFTLMPRSPHQARRAATGDEVLDIAGSYGWGCLSVLGRSVETASRLHGTQPGNSSNRDAPAGSSHRRRHLSIFPE